jgi:hypothetical protein
MAQAVKGTFRYKGVSHLLFFFFYGRKIVSAIFGKKKEKVRKKKKLLSWKLFYIVPLLTIQEKFHPLPYLY